MSQALPISRHQRRPLLFLLLAPLLLVLSTGCLGSSKVQRGDASWYGGRYHGRRTASGEVFDKNALTAAHKTLPFQTRVEVKNMETGRSVVVRVNDRFPGTKGRVIDLSEGAFRRIAPLERGVAPVEVRVLD